RVHFNNDSGGTLPATVLDFSSGGVRLSVRVGLDAKKLCERLNKEPAMLIVHVQAEPAPPLVLLGETRWSKLTANLEGMEIGLRFIAPDPALIAALGKLARGEPLVPVAPRSLPWLWPAIAGLAMLVAFIL